MTERQNEIEPPKERADRLRLAGVVVLGVVLSLIGFSVASRFQPPPGANPLVASPDEPRTSTTVDSAQTTTSEVTQTPQSGGQVGTTTTTPQEPAVLALSSDVLDFGASEQTLQIQISNTAGGSASWELTTDNEIVGLSPAAGTIGPGETVAVSVSLDRSQVPEGDFEAALTLSWADGELGAGVVASFEDNPIIHNPRASPATIQAGGGSGCSPTQTTVSARVRDTSEIDRVIARWSSDGSTIRETAMNPVGDDVYSGVIGPYQSAGSDSVKIVAFDVRGNAGGAAVVVTIAGCP